MLTRCFHRRMIRSHSAKVRGQGCFSQDAVGDWWLCLPVAHIAEPTVAPNEAVGIDLGIKDAAVTSDGDRLEAPRFYRE